MATHLSLGEVGDVECFAIVISFHSSAGSLDVLAVSCQDIVDLGVVIRNAFPVPDDSSPVENSTNGQQFRSRRGPVVSFPADVTDRVLDKSEEVLESSSFVAFIIGFAGQSVLFEFPVILFSHRSELRSNSTCR